MDASPTGTSFERVSELAAQLSACAADLERFLSTESGHLQAIYRQQEEQSEGPRRRFHPGSTDPVIAAVLTRFEQLETAAGQAGEG